MYGHQSGQQGFLRSNWGSWSAYADTSGNWFGTTSVRAPIFYDSDNTNYYINAGNSSATHIITTNWLGVGTTANSSGSYRLNIGGAVHLNNNNINYVNQLHFNDNVLFTDEGNDQYLRYKAGDTGGFGIKFYNGNDQVHGWVYGDGAGSNFGLLSNDGTWAVQCTTGKTTLHHRLDTPLMYDQDDTAYYVDPNSESRMARLHVGDGSNYIRIGDEGEGANTSYARIRTDSGGSLYLDAKGSSNIYLGWWSSSASRVYSEMGAQFPIYYDRNDTAYYANPAGNSRTNTEQTNYLGIGTAPNTSGDYRLNMGGHIDMNNYEINYVSQLHFQDNVRFYDEGNDQYLNFKWGDTGGGGIRFRDGDNLDHGRVYGDGSGGFGLLDRDGEWFVYTNGTSETQLRANNNPELYVYTTYVYAPGSFRAPIFYDSNNTAYYNNPDGYSKQQALHLGSETSHVNNSNYGLQIHDNNRYLASFKYSAVSNGNYPWIVHDSYNSTGAFIIHFNSIGDKFQFTQGGDGFAAASFRAPIFYDSDNTNYYAHFADTSVFNQINVTTLNSTSDIRFKSDLQKIDNAVDKLKTISGYTYTLNGYDDRKAGLIAQEVEAVLPEAVKGSEDKKLLDYQATIALLVEAVKEQQEQIDALKKQLNS